MINGTAKKIFSGLFAIALLFAITSITLPAKAHAQWVVTDPADTAQNTIGELEGSVTAVATTGQQLQSSVLDKVATAIAKQLLMQITQSVVTWINSGFNGNPSFIQNPSAFFENVGDQLTGEFISQNGALSSLCSPFSLQIRLAIALQRTQANNSKYTCTLSSIIQNAANAKSAGIGLTVSVNGFIAGDFSQGGLPAFAALTVQPQNNPNGAYLIAQDDLLSQINAAIAQKQKQLTQGQGFLSWESCTPNATAATTNSTVSNSSGATTNTTNTSGSISGTYIQNPSSVTPTNTTGTYDPTSGVPGVDLTGSAINSVSAASNQNSIPSDIAAPTAGDTYASGVANTDFSTTIDPTQTSASTYETGAVSNVPDPYNSAAEADPNQTCTVQTPGSVIAGTLNKHLAVPTENLELANSINDIINAAFSELIVIALQKGLTSVSATNTGGSSYLQSAINNANQQSFTQTQQTLLTSMAPFLATEKTIDQNYNQALALVMAASSTNAQAQSCYQTLENSPGNSVYSDADAYLAEQSANLENDALSLPGLAQTIINDGGNSSSTMYQYQTMYNQVVAATSTNSLAAPTQTFANLSQSGLLPTQANTLSSQTLLTNTQNTVQPIQARANTALQQCQSFSFTNYSSAVNR